MNRWDFRCRLNDDRVDAAVTVGGRLFQALVPAAEKDRSPSVDLRIAGTTNADELEDLSCKIFASSSINDDYSAWRISCLGLRGPSAFVQILALVLGLMQ